MNVLQFADPKTPESTPWYTVWFGEPIESITSIVPTPNDLIVIAYHLTTPYEIKVQLSGGLNNVLYAIAFTYVMADGSIENETIHLLVQSNL